MSPCHKIPKNLQNLKKEFKNSIKNKKTKSRILKNHDQLLENDFFCSLGFMIIKEVFH